MNFKFSECVGNIIKTVAFCSILFKLILEKCKIVNFEFIKNPL